MIKGELLFAQCSDEQVMVNNGGNVKGQRDVYESWTEKRGREEV